MSTGTKTDPTPPDPAVSACPTWCTREHTGHPPAIHAADAISITETVPSGNSKTRITDVSPLQFGDRNPEIRVHTYRRGHRCRSGPQVCSPSYIELGDAEERARLWEHGGSGEVAAAIRAVAEVLRQSLAAA